MDNMLKLFSLLLFTCILYSCSNQKPTSIYTCQTSHCYKRYTGKVAGQDVVVNMIYYKDSGSEVPAAAGSYYYSGKSQIITLTPDSLVDNMIHLTELVETEREIDENSKHPHWAIAIDEKTIKGNWISADGKHTETIDLHEDYDDAYSFDVLARKDSAAFTGKKASYMIRTEQTMLAPSATVSKDHAAFITRTLLHELGGDTTRANDFITYMKQDNQHKFVDYKNDLTEMLNANASFEGESYNWYSEMHGICVYNSKGIVDFYFSRYYYNGGAHGINGSTYICLDVKEKKVWRLQDILAVDTPKLSAMLEAEARKAFALKPTDTLSYTLSVDTIPVTGSIIISDRGITFHYDPYEIACYAMGDVSLYLSYTQLGEMLKPEFKKRMGLN
jgi:Protein of unknown function (DUF3298)